MDGTDRGMGHHEPAELKRSEARVLSVDLVLLNEWLDHVNRAGFNAGYLGDAMRPLTKREWAEFRENHDGADLWCTNDLPRAHVLAEVKPMAAAHPS